MYDFQYISSDTGKNIKEKLNYLIDIPVDRITLIFEKGILVNEKTLQEQNVQRNSIVCFFL
jgi:hypothetical protein